MIQELAAAGLLLAGPLQPTYLGTAGLEAVRIELSARVEGQAWPILGRGPALHPGDRGDEVSRLRARLVASDGASLAPMVAPSDPLLFDGELAIAVRDFQRRHGLEPDGIVGPATRAELDQTPLDRLRQIERTIAARRALPDDLGPRFLLVNLSALEIQAIEVGRPVLTLRVIVGRTDWPTPTLNSAVVGLIAHPFWNVPARIARQEISARVALDPDYLERLGIEVLSGGAGGQPIDPLGVDWPAFRRGELDLRLRQKPGPLNALGEVGIQFQNPHNICLHDTPDHRLFERSQRALSHGCIRVERVRDLASWLMEIAEEESREHFESALAGGLTEAVRLPASVPIYIVDWRVWVDADGTLQMRPKLYPERTP